jgi:hypothetical protein
MVRTTVRTIARSLIHVAACPRVQDPSTSTAVQVAGHVKIEINAVAFVPAGPAA